MNQYKLREYMAAEPEAKLRYLVARLLHDEIVALHIAPGSRLNVNQIAASLGISRTPVAEAIASLTDIGFVTSHPGQNGSYVLDLSLKDMISLYQVRSAIESEAAALAAYSASDTAVHELTVLAEAFHDRLLIESCGNPYLLESYELLLPKLTMYQSSMVEFIEDRRRGQPLDAERGLQPHLDHCGDPSASSGDGTGGHGRPCQRIPELHLAYRPGRRPVLRRQREIVFRKKTAKDLRHCRSPEILFSLLAY